MNNKTSNTKHILMGIFSFLMGALSILSCGSFALLYIAIIRKTKPFEANPTKKKKQRQATRRRKHYTTTIKDYKQMSRERMLALGKKWHDTTPHEHFTITSFDGLQLRAAFFPVTDVTSHRYVILIHGYTNSRKNMYDFAMDYHKRGYHVLLVDLRSHGESEGHYITMGWLDRIDIVQWIQLLIEKDPEASIVLHGVSMGAATVMMTSGEPLPENVKACVEDCGYTSVQDIFRSELKALYHLPAFPFLYIASWLSKRRAGYSFHEGSSIRQLEKCTVPMLFIHGKADHFVPYDMLDKLYDACVAPKEKYVVAGAGHVGSRYSNVDAYNEKVFTFLEKYVQ